MNLEEKNKIYKLFDIINKLRYQINTLIDNNLAYDIEKNEKINEEININLKEIHDFFKL